MTHYTIRDLGRKSDVKISEFFVLALLEEGCGFVYVSSIRVSKRNKGDKKQDERDNELLHLRILP